MVALGSAPPFISTSLITGPAPEPEVTRAISVGGEACYCRLLGVDAEVGGRAQGSTGSLCLVRVRGFSWIFGLARRGGGKTGTGRGTFHHDASRLFCFFHHSVRWAGTGAGGWSGVREKYCWLAGG